MAKISEIAEGLAIFRRYEDSHVAAEHDVIYVCETPPERMDADEVRILESLRWHWDEGTYNCWYHFV